MQCTARFQRAALTRPHLGLQVQLPLIPDDNIELVPGSYTRWDTAEEYRVRLAKDGKNRTSPIPGRSGLCLSQGMRSAFRRSASTVGATGGRTPA